AVHEPVFDEFDAVVDLRLLWWNRGYQTVRVLPVQVGQSLTATYFEPEVALEFANKAWNSGHAFQLFELGPEKRDRYRTPGASVVISVDWQRVGNLIVEVGSDLTEYRALQVQLADQRSLAFVANRDRALLAERERIARNLHDSVIQQIYAASLGLNAVVAQRTSLDGAARATDQETERIREIADRLSDLIKAIRDEIFDVSQDPAGSLVRDLENVLVPIVSPTPIEMTLDVVPIDVVDQQILTHLRSVVREAVSNAVRHAHCSRIAVHVHRPTVDRLELKIHDNGVGIPSSPEHRSGTANIDDRARDLGGWSTIERIQPGGTMVTWSIPLPSGSVKP
ncbi:MAG: sensor histidine kinase, partial [Actinomycetota bacterium]